MLLKPDGLLYIEFISLSLSLFFVCKVSMARHPSRPLLGVCYMDGILQLYDISKLQDDQGAGNFSGVGSTSFSMGSEAGDDEGGGGSSTSLFQPVVNLRPSGNAASANQSLSCLSFHPFLDLVVAGGYGKI